MKKKKKNKQRKVNLTIPVGVKTVVAPVVNAQAKKVVKRGEIARNGWCVFIDCIRMYTELTGKEPNTVYISDSLEYMLDDYFYCQRVFEANQIKSIRELNPLKIMGMTPIFDVPNFRLSREEAIREITSENQNTESKD